MKKSRGLLQQIYATLVMPHPRGSWGFQRAVRAANGLWIPAPWLLLVAPELAKDELPPFAEYHAARRSPWRFKLEWLGFFRLPEKFPPEPIAMYRQTRKDYAEAVLLTPVNERDVLMAIIAQELAAKQWGMDKRYWPAIYLLPLIPLLYLIPGHAVLITGLWCAIVASVDLLTELGRGTNVSEALAPVLYEEHHTRAFLPTVIARRGLRRGLILQFERVRRDLNFGLAHSMVFAASLVLCVSAILATVATSEAGHLPYGPPLQIPLAMFVFARSPLVAIGGRFLRRRIEKNLIRAERTLRWRRKRCQAALEM